MPQLPNGDISAGEVVWAYGESGQMSLYPYFGAISLTGTDTKHMVQEEGQGDAPVDAVFGGMVMELTVPMARNTLAQLAVVLSGTIVGNELTFENKAGCDTRKDAKAVVIKPMCNGVADTTKSKWIHLFHVYPFRSFDLIYNRSDQRVVNVVFTVFVSLESGQIGKFGTIGVN